MKYLALLFIVMPIVEMVVLIKVGGVIGVLPTVLAVVLTAMLGLSLLRAQGLSTVLRAQQKMQTGELPVKEMVEGICLAVGGALLLTPGFVTDAIGFACLIPGLRQILIGRMIHIVKPNVSFGHFGRASGERSTIEGEFRREQE